MAVSDDHSEKARQQITSENRFLSFFEHDLSNYQHIQKFDAKLNKICIIKVSIKVLRIANTTICCFRKTK